MKTYIIAKIPRGNKSYQDGMYAVLDAETGRIAWADTSKKEVRDNIEIMKNISEYNEYYKCTTASVRTAVYIDWSRGLIGCFLYNRSKPIVNRISLDKLVWYEIEELKEMKSITINFTDTFEKLTSTTSEINVEKVGTRSIRKNRKIIKEDDANKTITDKNDVEAIQDTQESINDKEEKQETDIKENDTEVSDNLNTDNRANTNSTNKAILSSDNNDNSDYTEYRQESKEDSNRKLNTKNELTDKTDNIELYINIMKIMLKGNKISLPIKVFNSLEKGPIYPVFSDFNTGNRVALVDIYIDEAEKHRKITVCIAVKNNCDYVDIEILKEYNSSDIPLGFKDDFKKEYLRWYKSTLHVKL